MDPAHLSRSTLCPRQHVAAAACRRGSTEPPAGPLPGAVETVDVDGLRTAFERAGPGPAVVLLHGCVADGRTTWRHQLDDLCDEFTVVAWDAPGAGASADPPEDFGIAGHADCLAAFVDRLGLGRPHVAGLSFGGGLAIALTGRHPALPRSRVLVSACAGWRGSLPEDVAAAGLRQAVDLSVLSPDRFGATLLPTMFSPSTPATDVRAPRAVAEGLHAGIRGRGCWSCRVSGTCATSRRPTPSTARSGPSSPRWGAEPPTPPARRRRRRWRRRGRPPAPPRAAPGSRRRPGSAP
ncbi:alpha/beta fold hydrolase [Geodermatophilus sp. SYSU D00815]